MDGVDWVDWVDWVDGVDGVDEVDGVDGVGKVRSIQRITWYGRGDKGGLKRSGEAFLFKSTACTSLS